MRLFSHPQSIRCNRNKQFKKHFLWKTKKTVAIHVIATTKTVIAHVIAIATKIIHAIAKPIAAITATAVVTLKKPRTTIVVAGKRKALAAKKLRRRNFLRLFIL